MDSTQQVQALIVPRTSDLGDGFTVRRALPSAACRMVGPFVFFDEMGPVVLTEGRGLDVRSHPHIGLSTVTYLFAGEILHRDSLGTVQPIRPAEVNWMTAGRGIVHSERTPSELRTAGSRLHGLQVWVALPKADEEVEPNFAHYGTEQLPVLDEPGSRIRLIAGSLFGARAPVATSSEMFYADVILAQDAQLRLSAEHEERAVYVVHGGVEVGSGHQRVGAGQLVVLAPKQDVLLRAAAADTRIMLLGGAALDGPRYVWWNFVSSSKERIEQAKADWREGRFAPVPQETERIPLPPEPAGGGAVRYP